MQLKILHVEDNADDVMLVGLAFRKAATAALIEVATDGEKAIAALNDCSDSIPSCVLLDIKLPRRSGLEVLDWIRQRPAPLRWLPVVILTSSTHSVDVNRAYDLGANSYLAKPDTAAGLLELMSSFQSYWLRFNQGPTL